MFSLTNDNFLFLFEFLVEFLVVFLFPICSVWVLRLTFPHKICDPEISILFGYKIYAQNQLFLHLLPRPCGQVWIRSLVLEYKAPADCVSWIIPKLLKYLL